MKHLKTYDEINEELTSTQRVWLNLPRFLVSFVVKFLFKMYPMLNFRWNEMKSKTTNSKYPSILTSSGSNPRIMDDDITKVSKSDIPSNTLGLGMFLRNWNIYLSNKKSKEEDNTERSVIYISKDEIKKGDSYIGERLSDHDVYPKSSFHNQKLKNISEMPLIVMIAKFDNAEKIKDMEKYIGDIYLEIEDDFPVSVKPKFYINGDYIYIDIQVLDDRVVKFSDNIDSRLNEVSLRVVNYLKMEKFKGFDYEINYYIKGPFYYTGNKGRFSQIIKLATKWSNIYDQDSNDPLWDKRKKCLNVSKLGEQYSEDELKLTGDDIRTLMSDLDNCKKIKPPSSGQLKVTDKKDSINEIVLRNISIEFKKNP